MLVNFQIFYIINWTFKNYKYKIISLLVVFISKKLLTFENDLLYLKVVLLYLLNLEQLDQTPVKNVRAFLIVCTLHYSFQEKQLQKKIETGFHTNTIIIES